MGTVGTVGRGLPWSRGGMEGEENSFRGIEIFMFNRPVEGRKIGAAEKSRGERPVEGAEPPEAAQKKDHCL